jgi:hypothetical protein
MHSLKKIAKDVFLLAERFPGSAQFPCHFKKELCISEKPLDQQEDANFASDLLKRSVKTNHKIINLLNDSSTKMTK